VLSVLVKAERQIVRLPGGRGGSPRKNLRKQALVGLTAAFKLMGRVPTAGSASKFPDFATFVFEGIGWSAATTGIKNAIREALKPSNNPGY